MKLKWPRNSDLAAHTLLMKAGVSFVVAVVVLAARATGAILQPTALADSETATEESERLSGRESTPTPALSLPSSTPIPTLSPTSTPAVTPTPKPTPTPTPKPTATPTPTPTNSSGYKDGTYSADGSYRTPTGTEKIGVSLQLSGGVIVASTVTVKAIGPISQDYQQDFVAHYAPYVNGKSIASLSLSKVASSSLTPNGFNNAVSSIKSQAQ